MAAVATMGAELNPPRETPSSRLELSWGSIFGGVFVALGVWIMLLTLGMAIGLTAVDSDNLATAKNAATGTGIGSVIALFLSLLVGGLVAARTAGIVDRGTGALHGAVLWGFTTLAGILVLGFALRAGVGAALNLGGQAVKGGAAMTGMTGQADLTQALGISGNELIAPINRRLAQQGKPTVTSTQIEAAARQSIVTGLREGRLDKQVLTSAIAEQTNLTSADARDIADRIETSFNQKRADVGSKVEGAVGDAVDASSTAMWWMFLAQFLGLGSAVLGATIGVSRKQRRLAGERVPVPVTTTTTGRDIATHREAHSHT